MNLLSNSGKNPAITGMGALLKAVVAAVKLVTAEEVMPRYLKVAHRHKGDGSLCTGPTLRPSRR